MEIARLPGRCFTSHRLERRIYFNDVNLAGLFGDCEMPRHRSRSCAPVLRAVLSAGAKPTEAAIDRIVIIIGSRQFGNEVQSGHGAATAA